MFTATDGLARGNCHHEGDADNGKDQPAPSKIAGFGEQRLPDAVWLIPIGRRRRVSRFFGLPGVVRLPRFVANAELG